MQIIIINLLVLIKNKMYIIAINKNKILLLIKFNCHNKILLD